VSHKSLTAILMIACLAIAALTKDFAFASVRITIASIGAGVTKVPIGGSHPGVTPYRVELEAGMTAVFTAPEFIDTPDGRKPFIRWTRFFLDPESAFPVGQRTIELAADDGPAIVWATYVDGRIYVDDDAPNDPGPHDPAVSDPLEDGSADHPYDTIQKAVGAISFPSVGAIITVTDGTYKGFSNYGIASSLRLASESGPSRCIIEGEVYLRWGYVVRITGFTLTGGRGPMSERGGGGIWCRSASLLLDNCVVTECWQVDGSCMYMSPCPAIGAINAEDSQVTCRNCVFAKNGGYEPFIMDWSGASTFICRNSQLALISCSLVENVTGKCSMILDSTTARFSDCILWDSYSDGYPCPKSLKVKLESGSSVTVESCNIRFGMERFDVGADCLLTWGGGYIDVDPKVSMQPESMGRLLPGSPCIDAGTNDVDNPETPEVETLPATDIAGLPRIIDGNLDGTATVDIGAYEYLPGDVNYDGKVNVLDLLLVRNSLGRDPASSIEARKADVNADGAVNVEDLLVVRGELKSKN